MTRSLLDDGPGVGATRRRALLRAFGSVGEMRVAAEAEIAKIVGPKVAQAVVARLRADGAQAEADVVEPSPADTGSAGDWGEEQDGPGS